MAKIKPKQKYTRLLVLEQLSKTDNQGNKLWLCECECGNFKEARARHLLNGDLKSCGCLKFEIENLSLPKLYPNLYKRWWGINKRCYSSSNSSYTRYKKLDVDPNWRNSFECFVQDMKMLNHNVEAVLEDTSMHLDRIDNKLGYLKGNVQILTAKENMRKRSTTKKVKLFGQELLLPFAVELYGTVDLRRTASRLRKGWTIEEALFIPNLQWKSLK